jgi:hypothetical protein
MAELDGPRITRRLESLEQRLAKLERFGNVITSTQTVQTFDANGKVITKLGKQSDSLYGLVINNSSGIEQVRLGEVAAGRYDLAIRPSTLSGVTQLIRASNFATVNTQIGSATGIASTAFVTGTAVSVKVNIGPAGRAVVMLGAEIDCGPGEGGYVSFKTTGAVTTLADDSRSAHFVNGSTHGLAVDTASVARIHLLSALSTGDTTFTLQQRSTSGGTVFFRQRALTVWPS